MSSRIELRTPAESWLECLPLGNGVLGAMLDGGIPSTRIRLNDETGWSGSPASESAAGLISASEAASQLATARSAIAADDPTAAEAALRALQVPYSQAYLPFAALAVHRSVTERRGYRRVLDLGTGIHELRAGGLREESFVSAVHGVFVHRIEGIPPSGVEVVTPHRTLRAWSTSEEVGVLLRLPSDVAPGHEPDSAAATWSDAPGSSIEGAVVVAIRREPGSTLLIAATQTTFGGLGRPLVGDAQGALAQARDRVERAADAGWHALRSAHEEDVVALLGRVTIDLGTAPVDGDGAPLPTDERLRRAEEDPRGPLSADPALVALLFDVGRYLLVCSSRPGSLPATLQGIWNDDMRPPWSSNYTLNINTEMNYWSAHPTALSECADPLLDFIQRLAEAGSTTAARLYGVDGWVAHHNSDAWLLTNPVGAGHGDARWTAWPLASLWLVTHVAEAIEFGAISRERLAGLWPAVRGAAEFALGWTRSDGHGGWSTSPATSPENVYATESGVAAVDETTSMDLTLVRAACATAVRVGERLGIDGDPVIDAARSLRDSLPPEPAVAADGAILEWSREREAEDEHHRHMSHLVGLYPGTTAWSEDARAAAALTLTRRGDESSGWSVVWKALLWARLGRGDRAGEVMSLLFRGADRVSGPFAGGLYRNMFAAHPPFQIDANLGFPALVTEMLVQSHDGIELLPAVPAALATGSARGLVARPGVRVDLAWSGGELVSARLRARPAVSPGTLRIRYAGSEIARELPSTGMLELGADDFAPAVGEAI